MPIQQKNNAKFIESVSVREFYDSFKEPLELDLSRRWRRVWIRPSASVA